MSHGLNGLYKTGGISFIISGALFFLKYLLDLRAGPSRSNGKPLLIPDHDQHHHELGDRGIGMNQTKIF